jgi:hypothetical protein
MREFLFGAAIGAIAMYLYLQGFGPLVGIAESWWVQVSAPQRSALQQ